MIRILFLLFFVMSYCSYAATKASWTQEQDMQLMNSIRKHNGASWSTIAAEVTGKINKQCRERYMCHLDPTIDKSPLSDTEISTLDSVVQALGQNWCEISKEYFTLPNGKRRTDLHLKNVWNSQHRSGKKNRKHNVSDVEHLEEVPTKKKKVTPIKITDTIFVEKPLYSPTHLGSSLLPAHPLLLNSQPNVLPSLLMLSSSMYSAPVTNSIFLQSPSNLVNIQQPTTNPTSDIEVEVTLSGPELATVFEETELTKAFGEDDFFCEDYSLLNEFNINTLN